jgi:hypothetical protein
MNRKPWLLIGVLSTFLFAFSFLLPLASAQETGFLSTDKATFLYGTKNVLTMNYEGEKVKFVLQSNGVLQLSDQSGRTKYLSFTSYNGSNAGIGYAIRPIYTIFPSMTFIEINANQGAHAMNCGYWIVGKRDGQWVTYVSLDSLATMGYTPNKWHQIATAANEDATGRFLLTSSHEYMPPGAQYGYQRQHAVDLRLQLFWDQNARWFGLKRL